jgi:hypothetical protein
VTGIVDLTRRGGPIRLLDVMLASVLPARQAARVTPAAGLSLD